jgi:hypothetical protein
MKNKTERCSERKDNRTIVPRNDMRFAIIYTSLLIVLALSLNSVSAQTTVNVTGGNSLGTGGAVSYSVGQLVYQTQVGNNGSVAQGVQQPFEISVVTAIEDTEGIALMMSAYPNPTTDYLMLEVNNFDLAALLYLLYDMQGRLIKSEKITEIYTTIEMNGLAPSTYFVKVIAKAQGSEYQKEVKTFKIIKIQ